MHPRASPGKYRPLVGQKPTLARYHPKQIVFCRTLATTDACPKRIHLNSFPPTLPGAQPGRSIKSQVQSFMIESGWISIFAPVSFAARRAFCPSLPIASES